MPFHPPATPRTGPIRSAMFFQKVRAACAAGRRRWGRLQLPAIGLVWRGSRWRGAHPRRRTPGATQGRIPPAWRRGGAQSRALGGGGGARACRAARAVALGRGMLAAPVLARALPARPGGRVSPATCVLRSHRQHGGSQRRPGKGGLVWVVGPSRWSRLGSALAAPRQWCFPARSAYVRWRAQHAVGCAKRRRVALTCHVCCASLSVLFLSVCAAYGRRGLLGSPPRR